MKRFVRSEAAVAYALGAVVAIIAAVTQASPGATYLLAFGVGAIGLACFLGPDRLRLWREQHDQVDKGS